jgi:hypothetical protein
MIMSIVGLLIAVTSLAYRVHVLESKVRALECLVRLEQASR